MPSHVTAQIEKAARLELETAGVLIAAIIQTPTGNFRLLVEDVIWVEDAAYVRREANGLSIASHGYVQALGKPSDGARWRCGFTRIQARMQSLSQARTTNKLIKISPTFPAAHQQPILRHSYCFAARRRHCPDGTLQRERQSTILIDRFWLVGSRWRLFQAYSADIKPIDPIFDRNVRAFGSAIQNTLRQLHVGIVGCGGTGSAIAEQLVRLGIRELLLIDPDTLSLSNTTRVYGSVPARVGEPKVKVLHDHLTAIAPDLSCAILASTINRESSAKTLTDCDLVFGCTDDNAGRLVLSRIATFLLTPVIDVGVLLSSDDNQILIGIDGRVTVMALAMHASYVAIVST